MSLASGTREAALTAQIQRTVADTAAQTGRAALSPRVLAALGTVRRDRFLPEDQRSLACLDLSLPIGYGQTISQPFIVAIMTDLLDLEPTDTVLEIGTGSGYQAAVLAQLARQVYSIEVVPRWRRGRAPPCGGKGFAMSSCAPAMVPRAGPVWLPSMRSSSRQRHRRYRRGCSSS